MRSPYGVAVEDSAPARISACLETVTMLCSSLGIATFPLQWGHSASREREREKEQRDAISFASPLASQLPQQDAMGHEVKHKHFPVGQCNALAMLPHL